MTLAPYWAHLLPHFRLLHVLRDGRDIAFSANQGPVEKFFTVMYGPQVWIQPLSFISIIHPTLSIFSIAYL